VCCKVNYGWLRIPLNACCRRGENLITLKNIVSEFHSFEAQFKIANAIKKPLQIVHQRDHYFIKRPTTDGITTHLGKRNLEPLQSKHWQLHDAHETNGNSMYAA
jgi:hypothetical protein